MIFSFSETPGCSVSSASLSRGVGALVALSWPTSTALRAVSTSELAGADSQRAGGVIHVLYSLKFRWSLNPSLVEGFDPNLVVVEPAYPWNLGFEICLSLSHPYLISFLLSPLFSLLCLLPSFLCLRPSFHHLVPGLLHSVLGFLCTF